MTRSAEVSFVEQLMGPMFRDSLRIKKGIEDLRETRVMLQSGVFDHGSELRGEESAAPSASRPGAREMPMQAGEGGSAADPAIDGGIHPSTGKDAEQGAVEGHKFTRYLLLKLSNAIARTGMLLFGVAGVIAHAGKLFSKEFALDFERLSAECERAEAERTNQKGPVHGAASGIPGESLP